jgi:hypothetical protein
MGRAAKDYVGDALQWHRLSFADRKAQIEKVLTQHLEASPGAKRLNEATVVLPIRSQRIALQCSGIPAGLSVAAARELVGQPFLKDYVVMRDLPQDEVGPVHLIGCSGNVTEAQARRQLGFPDATIVPTPQGIWMADPVQMIQVFFLSGCIDAASTRLRLQDALNWLDNSNEADRLVKRAQSRARIVRTIAQEVR